MAPTQRTWLVTGASSGFGTEISLAALQKGDKVVGTARNVKKAEQNNPEFAKLGGVWLELDVTSSKCEEVVAKAVKEHNVDHGNHPRPIRNERFGAFAVLKGAIPHFRTHRRGTIVNISSTAAIAPHCYFSSYAATKFALEGASEFLAEELSAFNIRVLIVAPGAFRTSFFGALSYTPISEVYKGTVVEETVKAFETIDGTQPGDPVKAGKAIVDVVRGEGLGKGLEGNLRVQLGTDAVVKTREKAKRLREDWGRAEEVGNSCAYDS
ncbi:hypothetical protein PRZ48_011813 [Zasmidium cellare]|uniref:NAD(P)-binding protein n=1 Tax=Zasmidium cellare TaxID=395010 RepID=A0ABR0E7G1_ZASCE|nr:hypothetical protein PRZ48_011813 [Zasmidium cellare]